MIDRAGAQDRLGTAEQILDLQQTAVAQHRLQWCDLGIGAQHEDAVEARLFGQFAGVDLEGRAGLASAAWRSAQIAAAGRIADQRLVVTRAVCRARRRSPALVALASPSASLRHRM